MFRHLITLIALAIGLGVVATSLMAQEPGTSPLPPVAETTRPDDATPDDDPNLTPPPVPTPTLPASAKRSSLMVKQGEKEIEYRISYSHFSKNTIFVDGVAMLPVLVVGEVAVERMRKEMVIAGITGRYGLRDNLEAELRVPFRYQFERHAIPNANPPQENTLSAFGLGDIEGGLSYQLHRASPRDTRWIVSAGIKAATGRDSFSVDPDTEIPLGTGFWSSKVGISGMRVSDPAAVFWSFGYTYNWERKNVRVVSEDATTGDPIVSYVDIKPGNTFDFGGGIAYALNPQLSLNTGVSVSFNSPTTSNGRELPNTAIVSSSLRIGTVYVPERGTPLDLGLSIGLTDDSPDFTLDFRQTFKF